MKLLFTPKPSVFRAHSLTLSSLSLSLKALLVHSMRKDHYGKGTALTHWEGGITFGEDTSIPCKINRTPPLIPVSATPAVSAGTRVSVTNKENALRQSVNA